MKKSIALFVAFICILHLSIAQDLTLKPKDYKALSAHDLKLHLDTLASKTMEGRYTGSIGQQYARDYIAQQFKSNGLSYYNDTSYFQTFYLWTWHWGKGIVTIDNESFTSDKELIYFGNSPIATTLTAPCQFIGYGSDTIVNSIDLNDKIALACVDDLRSYYRLYNKVRKAGAIALLIVKHKGQNNFTNLHERLSNKSQAQLSTRQPTFSSSGSKIIAVQEHVAEKITGIPMNKLVTITEPEAIKDIAPKTIQVINPAITKKVPTDNVAGILKGSGNTDETIVISAHYDHLGVRGEDIMYGADDNASGTAAVIALSKAFSKLKIKPERNILFLATSGEELGLLGALHFANQQKHLPLNIVGNINIDMIGRVDSTDKSNYVYLIGPAKYPAFDSLCIAANRQLDHINLDYAYNKNAWFGNLLNLSDHYAFHKQGIPVLGFFSGMHSDYHKSTDTPDKINYIEMNKRVRLIFATAYLASYLNTLEKQD